MLPISVDLARLPVLLAGCGPALQRRLGLLDEAGAAVLEIYAPDADAALAATAGHRLRRRWPRRCEIARARLVFLAGVPEPKEATIIGTARQSGALVNVEDDTPQSDFHSAAVLRRGDLSLAVSTSGRSPALAALLRRRLETLIGPEWAGETDALAALRDAWRAAGADAATIGRLTAAWIDRPGRRPAAPPVPSLAPRHPLP